ncbi:recombinase family protein [Pseudomonas serboccidentalis]|uniref:Recombinase family protein n=1 Tax=Pseudomonas serboccidentalis TaxID=2964670 RepID=A0ABY7Z5K5_9PSED|nr:recombinase family protein [Pseudomonas serboccidentalis]WDR34337.1 recombinase family protein [Pseudomonas serboccidentalis]
MSSIGYVRVSSNDQNTDRQLDGAALDEVFTDKVSGATTERPELQAMLRHIRKGDVLHVHSIDRLARSLEDLLSLVKGMIAKGVEVQFHKEGLHFTGEASPMQELMLGLLGSVAQFERALIRERQAEGIQKAKAAGVYKGRVKTVNDEAIRKAMAEDGASFRKVAKALGVSLSSVQRAMKNQPL